MPIAKWVEAPAIGERWEYTPSSNFIYFLQSPKLLGMRFDPKARAFGNPFEVQTVEWKPDDAWVIRGPGLVFTRQEKHGSVWLMKLPD